MPPSWVAGRHSVDQFAGFSTVVVEPIDIMERPAPLSQNGVGWSSGGAETEAKGSPSYGKMRFRGARTGVCLGFLRASSPIHLLPAGRSRVRGLREVAWKTSILGTKRCQGEKGQ